MTIWELREALAENAFENFDMPVRIAVTRGTSTVYYEEFDVNVVRRERQTDHDGLISEDVLEISL